MPGAGDLPRNTADWTPDGGRAALLVHDMQKYFVRPFPRHLEPGGALVDNTRALVRRARACGVPVLYTAQPGRMTPEQRGLLKDFWGPGMTTTADDREVIDELAPDGDSALFTKWRYSAFHGNGLLEHLRATGRDQLVVCGVYAHVGCLMTAVEAFTHDIETFLVADAVADFSAEHHRMALEYAASRCSVVLTTHAVLAHLDRTGLVARAAGES
ncbi:isochorismatase family protein [Saccharothrix syringae]|uniref:Isochorismatase family protein n=2 Tax=Saccharothrix syringae TaxID=103733 RepID=A0A5Q0HDJ9_SACSY|nr:isochorismatase family protein [Saccharothrix syringae]